MVSIETIEEEILDLEKRDTSYAVCERLAWLYIVRDHLKKPTVDATATEPRVTDELTGSEGCVKCGLCCTHGNTRQTHGMYKSRVP